MPTSQALPWCYITSPLDFKRVPLPPTYSCVCHMCAHMPQRTCRSQRTTFGTHIDPGDQTQVVMFGGKFHNPLSHLVNLWIEKKTTLISLETNSVLATQMTGISTVCNLKKNQNNLFLLGWEYISVGESLPSIMPKARVQFLTPQTPTFLLVY